MSGDDEDHDGGGDEDGAHEQSRTEDAVGMSGNNGVGRMME